MLKKLFYKNNYLSHRSLYALVTMLFISLANITTASASLLITPTRVELGNRDRSTTISLVNTGSETKTYKIFWREQYQLPEGNYQTFDPQVDKNYSIASNMIRYSPKQVTLAPGERQHVRMAVRKPKDLADGEYRSHLVFEAVPNIEELEKKRNNESGIKIYVNLAFSIPVIIYKGEKNVKTTLDKIELFNETREGIKFLNTNIHINRSGLYSAFGTLKLFWTDKNNNTEKQIGILNNVTIYKELNSRVINMGLKNHEVSDGKLRIEYIEKNNLKNKVLINEVIDVSTSDYIKK